VKYCLLREHRIFCGSFSQVGPFFCLGSPQLEERNENPSLKPARMPIRNIFISLAVILIFYSMQNFEIRLPPVLSAADRSFKIPPPKVKYFGSSPLLKALFDMIETCDSAKVSDKERRDRLGPIVAEWNNHSHSFRTILDSSGLGRHSNQQLTNLFLLTGLQVGSNGFIAPGVHPSDSKALVCMHFCGLNQQGPRPLLAAGHARYEGTGKLREPVTTVLDAIFCSWAQIGLLDASTNFTFVEVISACMPFDCRGSLPPNVTNELKKQFWISMGIHLDVTLIKQALHSLLGKVEFDVDACSVNVAMKREDSHLIKTFREKLETLPRPVNLFPVILFSANKRAIAMLHDSIDFVTAFLGFAFYRDPIVTFHLTGSSSNHDASPWMRHTNAQVQHYMRASAELVCQVNQDPELYVRLMLEDAYQGYLTPFGFMKSLTKGEEEFIKAQKSRAEYSSEGMENALLGTFRIKGSNRGSLIHDANITQLQFLSTWSSEAFANGKKGKFRIPLQNSLHEFGDVRYTESQFAGLARGQYSAQGFANGSLGNFRVVGSGAGSLEVDGNITDTQHAGAVRGRFSSAGFANARADIFRALGSGAGTSDLDQNITLAQLNSVDSCSITSTGYSRALLGIFRGEGGSDKDMTRAQFNRLNTSRERDKNGKFRSERIAEQGEEVTVSFVGHHKLRPPSLPPASICPMSFSCLLYHYRVNTFYLVAIIKLIILI
jgi:hypothetical protein